jgi:hypothetical protein
MITLLGNSLFGYYMPPPENPKRIDLRDVFLGLQARMTASLSNYREVIQHPGTKGDAAELEWRTLLNQYLPKRYSADSAFVLDCEGNVSEQIDIVIYDRQYSPFLFNQNDARFLPSESVYAVFEVKQTLSAANIKYAGEKACTVRRLRRTSAPIRHAGGQFEPIQPPQILAGILVLSSEWRPPLGEPFGAALKSQIGPEQLDLGCALECGGFEVEIAATKDVSIQVSRPETALIYFFLRLLSRLQSSGTVAAMDLREYGRVL